MKILVIRLTAMGDVALCLPVLRSALNQNKDLQIDLLTKPFMSPVFENVTGLRVLPYDMDGNHRGLPGICKLFTILRSHQYDLILDLHNVLRTLVLSTFFRLYGSRVFSIDKERLKKKSLLGKLNESEVCLKHNTERYAQVFRDAGFRLELDPHDLSAQGILHDELTARKVEEWIRPIRTAGRRLAGIAPFSQHRMKEYPLQRVKDLMRQISAERPTTFIIFAAGKRELDLSRELTEIQHGQVFLSAEHFSFREELALMRRLDFMVSMDSANMHLAELAGCPRVVSVWGPTHEALGFAPYFSGRRFIVEIPVDELPCRPCSLYGEKPCHRGDHACMNQLSPDRIAGMTLVDISISPGDR